MKITTTLLVLCIATTAFSQREKTKKPGVSFKISTEAVAQPSEKLNNVLDYFEDQDRLTRVLNAPCNDCDTTVDQLEKQFILNSLKEIKQHFASKISIDEHDFLRIEGHQGKVYKTKEEVINAYQEHLAIEIKELLIKIQINEKEIEKHRLAPIPPPAILEDRMKAKKTINKNE
ncbi:hypothetical protein DCS32_01845 [Dokdonia sp. Dokd-P16]|uniref:hypothetical protein n=1 Tax=Dokdonia sp. Dokd-P16 TaxID=2173169 RepID=UPI000D5447BF|nr:hypothetical protein [Dokdonia sp. Dokd-P16]AWH72948.1 hypothetical protein DCS32_01845 [Dokdonia sp. Dokd-P16]